MSREHMACSAAGTVDRHGQQNTICDVRGLCQTINLKHTETVFLLNSTDSLCLWVAWMLEIWQFSCGRLQTKPTALPLAHAHRVNTAPRKRRKQEPTSISKHVDHLEGMDISSTPIPNMAISGSMIITYCSRLWNIYSKYIIGFPTRTIVYSWYVPSFIFLVVSIPWLGISSLLSSSASRVHPTLRPTCYSFFFSQSSATDNS